MFFVKKKIFIRKARCVFPLSTGPIQPLGGRWTVSHPIILSVYYADLHSMCAFLMGSRSGGQEARSVVRRE